MVGGVLILYAMVAYPIIGTLLGHGYPRSPSFGVAPCPTTIFTIGMLAFLSAPFPRYVFAIPIAWALIGSQAALQFGVYEDLGLLVAGLAAVWLAFDFPTEAKHA
jgi:hypothetical protein